MTALLIANLWIIASFFAKEKPLQYLMLALAAVWIVVFGHHRWHMTLDAFRSCS